MDLNNKLAQAKREQKEQRKWDKYDRLRMLKIIGIAVICICSIIFITLFILSLVRFHGMTTTSELEAAKIYKLVSIGCGWAVCILSLFVFSMDRRRYGDGSSFYSMDWVVGWAAFGITAAIVFIASMIGIGKFNVEGVFCDTHGSIYYEYKDCYHLQKISDAQDVIIVSEINGKAVTSVSEFVTPLTKSLTIEGGNWRFYRTSVLNGQGTFANANMLEKITLDGANVTVDKCTFIYCTKLKEVFINNATFTVSLSSSDTATNDDSWDIFYNSDVSIYLKNGSLINLPDDLALLDISGTSGVDINLRISAESSNSGTRTPYLCVKKAIFHEDTDFAQTIYKRNSLSYWVLEDAYYPIGNYIYLPSTITEIPNYFFGNVMEQDVEAITVYFTGTKEEWDSIAVGNIGNENFFSGRVTVEYNYTENGKNEQ